MMDEIPVVVAGGGPAGAAAALALARGGRRVLLADAPLAAFRVGEALPPAARPLLRDLGVLERFLADGHLPSTGNVSVWGSHHPHAHDFLFDPQGHGWHLDRARFDAQLRAAAADAGAEVVSGATGADAERVDGRWRIVLRGEAGTREVRCGWLVDATGRRAAVARRNGAVRVAQDALVAFYARFRPADGAEPDRDARTVIEAAPDGWGYTALLPSGERIVAYLTDADLAERAALLSAEGFEAACGGMPHIHGILASHGYAIEGRPRGTDAGSARLDRFAGDGWLAAGDAALSFDPLSSQGMLNALYTGMRAGQAADRALSGDPASADEYVRRLDEIHRAYQRNRLTYYGAEGRWPDRPFWHRRTPALPPAAGIGALEPA